MRRTVRTAATTLLMATALVASTASTPAYAMQPPTDLQLSRHSGHVGESVSVAPVTLCPAGSISGEVRLWTKSGHYVFYADFAVGDRRWLPVDVPFDASRLGAARQVMLRVFCWNSSGQQTHSYEAQTFEVKNGSFWYRGLNHWNEQFVARVYHDLFDRHPDPTGLTAWASALAQGIPPTAVADGITSSREYRLALVSDAYSYYLGRTPEPAGHDAWVTHLDSGATIEHLEAGIMASLEYFEAFAGNDLDRWVRVLYDDVLGRTPSDAEVSYWTTELRSGRVDRYATASLFLRSVEHLRAIVEAEYRYLLAREAEPSGRDWWVGAIQNGMRREQLVAGITGSREYGTWADR